MISFFILGLSFHAVLGYPAGVDIYPELRGNHYQGDIVATGPINGLLDETYRWPNGVMPYEIVGDFTEEQLALINQAIENYHTLTCLKLRPKTDDDVDYVSIKNNESGCWSYVGRQGGKQEINLASPGCVKIVGTAMHELMHAFGFFHEQSRFDRDDYVTIVWENILTGSEGNFDIYSEDVIGGFGQDYDYGSVMHYPATAFTNNGEDTIITKDPNAVIGQREGFSQVDIAKLNNMYEGICTKN